MRVLVPLELARSRQNPGVDDRTDDKRMIEILAHGPFESTVRIRFPEVDPRAKPVVPMFHWDERPHGATTAHLSRDHNRDSPEQKMWRGYASYL